MAKKSQKQIIQELVEELSIEEREDLNAIVTDALDLHDNMKNCYFWNPPSHAHSRRQYEERNSNNCKFILGGNTYYVEQKTTCSCKNIYYTLYIWAENECPFTTLNASFLSKISDAIDKVNEKDLAENETQIHLER